MKIDRSIDLALAILAATVTPVILASPSALQPASAIDSMVMPSSTGGADSYNPIVSPDGRYVLFASRANNLALAGTNGRFPPQSPPRLNVFLRDRVDGTTTLVSINLNGTGGGNGNSVPTGLSTNGQFALFESDATDLVAGDTNDCTDVFLRDLHGATTTLLSVSTNGGLGNGRSWQSVLSPDGRYVAFSSAANNLVFGDTNGIPDIFVRDTLDNTTVLASPGNVTSPSCDSPQITPNGRYVAFLGPITRTNYPVVNLTGNDVSVYDLLSGAYVFRTNAFGLIPGSGSFHALFNHSISDDAQYVVFQVGSALPVAGVLLRYNILTHIADLISTNSVVPLSSQRHFRSLDMTPDGRLVTYVAKAGSSQQIYLWDAQMATNILVSANITNGPSVSASFDWPKLDASGRFIVFLSDAKDLTTNAVADGFHLYLRDMQASATSLIDVDTNGVVSAKDFLNAPQLTPDGRFVAFDCTDANLVPNDNNNAYDVFVYDLTTHTFDLVSARQAALPSSTGNAPVAGSGFSVSSDGRFVAFSSTAANLVPNCTNTMGSIFVRDLWYGTNLLVSVDTNGLAGANGVSFEPSISADGRYVAFTSTANNLVPGDTNTTKDIFVRDLQGASTILLSTNAVQNGPSFAPSISSDGQSIFFHSHAAGFPAGYDSLSWRNLQSATNTVVAASSVFCASMTPNGRFVAYGSFGGNAYVWDAVFAAIVYTNITPAISNIAISPDGNRIAAAAGNQVYVSDRAATTNWTLVSAPPLNVSSHANLQFSSDGRFLVYVTAAGQVSQDTNGAPDVYLFDFQTQTNQLISKSCYGDAAGDGPSDSPTISADGRFIAYRSAADNLVPGDTNGVPDVFLFDRVTATTTLLSVSSLGDFAANNRSLTPLFSADGRTLVFLSWASDLVAGDYNQQGDLFAIHLAASNIITAVVGQIIFSPLSGGAPSLTWAAQSGVNYRVEFKNDLSDPAWQQLGGTVTIVGDHGFAGDPGPRGMQRFYRIVAY